jgi:NADPH-dependent ferric siderophore reductase
LQGPELAALPEPEPAASVRLLLPGPQGLALPEWTGNEFVLADGSRPVLRTLTPRRFSASAGELDLEIVVHGDGILSRWAATVQPGAEVAVSGPARGFSIDGGAERFFIAGDETALPAMSQLLEVLPTRATVEMHVEIADECAIVDLPPHPGLRLHWHPQARGRRSGDALFESVSEMAADEWAAGQGRIWVAGEAAAVQRIRRLLFDERGVDRSSASIRGYWKLNSPATL